MLSRGPNSLNLASYAQGQGDQYSYDPNQMQQLNEQEGVNMEQQFDAYVRDIQKYDQILAKVAKSIQQVSAQQHFITDFYPQFALSCTYELDEEKKIIADTDVQIAKVVDNLQRNNRNLKQEMKGWLFQYAKKTRLSQVLLSQNKLLRKYVSAKNKDIVKLITAITNAQNEQLNNLNEDLNQLKQENGVLMDHLKQIKYNLKQKQDEQKKVVEAYQRAERDKIAIQAKIQTGQDQQQHYSKMVSLLQASIDDATKREKRLLDERERLKKIKLQYENDNEEIEKQIDACKIDREDINKHLKAKFKGHQTEKQTLMDQIQQLTEKVQKIKAQSQNHKQQITRYQRRIEQYGNICNDIDKKSAQVQQVIGTLQQQYKKLKEIQIQHLTGLDMINFDIDVLREELKQLQEQEQDNIQRYKKQLKEIENQKKQQLAKWNQQNSKTQWKVSRAIMQEKANLAVKKKEIEDWENKITEKKHQIEDLKQQMIQIKQNQAQLANLKQKLRQAERK